MEGTMQSEGPMTKKKLEEYFEVFSKEGYIKAIPTYFAEDAVFENSIGMEACGIENILKLLDYTHRDGIVKETLTPVTILIDGDGVAVELVMEAVVSEDVLDYHMASLKKGESVKVRLGVFYKIKDGKIARAKVYPAAAFEPVRR
jgi:ketosteroid isomerase-like protein